MVDTSIKKKSRIKKVRVVIVILFVAIIIPFFVMAATTLQFINVNTENQWIGFWGSYFGGILGSIATIAGVTLTIEEEQRKRREEEAARSKEENEKRRLDILPYMTSGYSIVKSEEEFDGTVSSITNFTVDSPVTNNYSRARFEKEIADKLKSPGRYYLLRYRIKNAGLGSAVKFDLAINNLKSIINGCLEKNGEIDLVILFLVEDLKDKELDIEIKYADVVGLGKYEQNEKLSFKEKDNDIILSKAEPMSEPIKIERQ